jgi:hypothetical protein
MRRARKWEHFMHFTPHVELENRHQGAYRSVDLHHLRNHIILPANHIETRSVDSILIVKHKNLADPAPGPAQTVKTRLWAEKQEKTHQINKKQVKTHDLSVKHKNLADSALSSAQL